MYNYQRVIFYSKKYFFGCFKQIPLICFISLFCSVLLSAEQNTKEAAKASSTSESSKKTKTPLQATVSEQTQQPKERGRKKETPNSDGQMQEMKEAENNILEQYTKLAETFVSEKEEPKTIYTYQCKSVRSATMKRVLENFITSSGMVAEAEENDVVIVCDVPSNLEKIKKITAQVDQRVPQVRVLAQIVELTLDSDFEKEINTSFEHASGSEYSLVKSIVANITTPGANPNTGQGANLTLQPYVRKYENGKSNTLNTFLRYLETRGKAKILSAPNLTLRRGSEGSIITGQEVPILQQTVVSGSVNTTTVFKSVGIKLKVNPIMIAGDTVRISVNPEVSTVTGYSSTGEGGVSNPIIAVRNAKTELEVKDGELISIGGLLRNEEVSVKRRVPIAGSLPLLGHFFRSTRTNTVKTQLIIFLSITILKEGEPNGIAYYSPAHLPKPVETEIQEMEGSPKKPKAQILDDLNLFIEDGRQW